MLYDMMDKLHKIYLKKEKYIKYSDSIMYDI